MQTIYVDATKLPLRSQFIRDKQGKLDLVGTIITELGYKIEPGTRTPQHMNRAVDPISVYYRQSFLLTPLGYNLLFVTNLPISQQIPAANKLLNPHNITIITSPVKKVVPVEVPYDALSIRGKVEEWLGMPIPQQHEDVLAKGIKNRIKPEAIADMICDLL